MNSLNCSNKLRVWKKLFKPLRSVYLTICKFYLKKKKENNKQILMRYHYTLTRKVNTFKRLTIPNVAKDVEQPECSWSKHLEHLSISSKDEYVQLYVPGIPFHRYPTLMYVYGYREIHWKIHSVNISHNLETIQMATM